MNRLLKNFIVFCLSLFTITLCASCSSQTVVKREFSVNEIKELAQLATLECSFNNVATIKQDSTIVPGFNLFMDNSRKAIIEYQGIAKLGIDTGKIQYDDASKTMVIPVAEVLSVTDDPNSYDIIANDEGFWKNKIKDDIIKKQIKDSLDEIRENLSTNKVMLRKAQGLARVQIEELINSLYTINGKTPDIKFEIE